VVFLLINPYFLIKFSETLSYFSYLSGRTGPSVNALEAYADFFFYTLPITMGWPLFLFSLAGVPLMIRDSRPQSLAAVAFVFLYIVKFGPMKGPLLNYYLPVVIFLTIFAARFAAFISRKRLGILIVALVSIYTAAYTIYLKSFFWRPASPVVASEWIEKNIPVGAAIAIPKNDTWTPPIIRQYHPPYKVIEAASSQAHIRNAVTRLPSVISGADYLVIAEPEFGPGVSGLTPAEINKVISPILTGFTEIKRFETRLNRFFLPTVSDLHKYELKLMVFDIRIYKRTPVTAPAGLSAARIARPGTRAD
jgi:hypothetical protein